MNKKCFENGRCRLKNNFDNLISSECVCEKGFFGRWCQLTKNACLSSPCFGSENKCVPTALGSYQCVCSERFDGFKCDRVVKLKRSYMANLNDGKSYIELPGLGTEFDLIDLIFMTNNSYGMWLGHNCYG